jgi:hypothetical protein
MGDIMGPQIQLCQAELKMTGELKVTGKARVTRTSRSVEITRVGGRSEEPALSLALSLPAAFTRDHDHSALAIASSP